MKHFGAVIVATSLLLGTSPSLAASAAASVQTTDDPTLRPANLKLSDMPSGWKSDPKSTPSYEDDAEISVCGVPAPLATQRSDSSFRNTQSAVIASTVMRLPKGEGKRFVDALTIALKKGCTQDISIGLEGVEPIEAKLVFFAVPKLGDQQLGMRVLGAPITSETVFVRKGDALAMISRLRIGNSVPSVVPLATKVARRLATIK
jgi:hypothetical protein